MVDLPGFALSSTLASFFLILLAVKEPVDFKVIGPAYPILAKIGEDAVLTCQLLPKRNAINMEVRWYRSELSTPVCVYRDGAVVTEMQMEEYRSRIEWIEDNINEGNVALKIHNIQPSDHGQYWCHFQDGSYSAETSLQLRVAGMASDPDIHMKGIVEGGVQLDCTAEGWFPQPQVYWKNRSGEDILTFSEHHFQNKDGLFYVESTLVVRDASVETVSCVIHSPILNEEKKSTISIPEKLQAELASSQVIGPSQPILVRVGEDVQLTCHLLPKANSQNLEVRWVRLHRYPAVYVYMDGNHLDREQMEEYRGRTVLLSDATEDGRLTLTLKIHGAKVSDDGQYRCLFEKDGVYQESSLDLKVADMGSSPRITMKELKDGEMELTCSSDGWFPQPHVQWRNMEGQTIPLLSEILTQDSHGLFHVETSVLVRNSSVNVTCSISNSLLGQEKMATFPSSGYCFQFIKFCPQKNLNQSCAFFA
ncbi:PREDICTED: butyrophilin-like protein 2-like [Elephantulus edwardii]|uniref:butyrophilin-like protein 2-like n=1 Tax=Elephantulus edwardii TaxID=28737 RepID=UPI0003F060C8|nr:PREDICTED: butyrophilin-like protein 2-like [Elephantulus edwardii]